MKIEKLCFASQFSVFDVLEVSAHDGKSSPQITLWKELYYE